MKKILNKPEDYVDEMLDGLVAAHPDIYAGRERRVITRAGGAVKGKVGIVTGGGSGHLPVFTGYVGKGLLDAGGDRQRLRLALGRADGGRHAARPMAAPASSASTATMAAT